MDEVERVARRSVEVFDAAEWDRVGEFAGPDYAYEEVGSGRRAQGGEAWVEIAKGWKAAFPDARGEVLQAVTAGDSCVLEIAWSGTHDGPLPLGATTLAATGREVRVPAVMLLRVRDGRVSEARHHIDLFTMLGQLGALPEPAHA